MGILATITSKLNLTVLNIVQRIRTQHDRFSQKYANKRAAEDEYYASKYDAPALPVAVATNL
jgi:hypothetical protein